MIILYDSLHLNLCEWIDKQMNMLSHLNFRLYVFSWGYTMCFVSILYNSVCLTDRTLWSAINLCPKACTNNRHFHFKSKIHWYKCCFKCILFCSLWPFFQFYIDVKNLHIFKSFWTKLYRLLILIHAKISLNISKAPEGTIHAKSTILLIIYGLFVDSNVNRELFRFKILNCKSIIASNTTNCILLSRF